MSPKEEPRQPVGDRSLPQAETSNHEGIAALFWVQITDVDTAEGLSPGDPLMPVRSEASVRIFRGSVPVGVLEPRGVEWVEAHDFTGCTFVGYGENARERFRVRITAD